MENTPATPAVSPGTRLTITIDDIAFGGEGVGRVADFVVFVPFVALGEQVEVEVVEVKKRFARAKLLRVVTASPARVQPQCRYFGVCGGCQYQHLDYAAQLELKRKQITDLFQRIGGFAGTLVHPVQGCPSPYGYRNRIMIRSGWNKPLQKLDIGYVCCDSQLVVDIEECPIAEPEISAQIRQVRANPPPRGGIKVVLRMMPEGWELPQDSFFQNNFRLLPGLVKTVRDRLHDGGAKNLVDAYCGVGFFGIELADLVTAFIGVEVDLMAVRAARNNMAKRGITNGEFITARTEDLLPDLLKRFPPDETAIILDPPRTGCPPESLALLRTTGLHQIIYVSCHPATLARDVKLLCEDGRYTLNGVYPLDMFPQTQHVECVVDLRRVQTA
ncbi:MAG: class I SAM-dependent RNA methyltransferase [Verrucomicrobiota bacterium]